MLHHLPAVEPHQFVGVPELADFYGVHSIKQHAWSRANHTGALGAAPCAGCAAGLAYTDSLAPAVTATALLTCLLTLVCVWLLCGAPACLLSWLGCLTRAPTSSSSSCRPARSGTPRRSRPRQTKCSDACI